MLFINLQHSYILSIKDYKAVLPVFIPACFSFHAKLIIYMHSDIVKTKNSRNCMPISHQGFGHTVPTSISG